jgi:hypothetical protein
VARTLFGRAIEQGGYFTAKQAIEVGYSYSHLDYQAFSQRRPCWAVARGQFPSGRVQS